MQGIHSSRYSDNKDDLREEKHIYLNVVLAIKGSIVLKQTNSINL